MSLFFNVV